MASTTHNGRTRPAAPAPDQAGPASTWGGQEQALRPTVTIHLHTDTDGQVLIEGRSHPVHGQDLAATRQAALDFLLDEVAIPSGRSVTISALDATGSNTLVLHPNGTLTGPEDLPATDDDESDPEVDLTGLDQGGAAETAPPAAPEAPHQHERAGAHPAPELEPDLADTVPARPTASAGSDRGSTAAAAAPGRPPRRPGPRVTQRRTPADTDAGAPGDVPASPDSSSRRLPAASGGEPADFDGLFAAAAEPKARRTPRLSRPKATPAAAPLAREQPDAGTARDDLAPPAPPAAVPTLATLLEERRQLPPAAALEGWQGVVHRLTAGLISPTPGPREASRRRDVSRLQSHVAGPRTIVVVNPKGGAHKTTSTMLLAAQFGLHRGTSTLAWDNNETRGTLGWASQPGPHHTSTVDLLAELELRQGGYRDRARTIAPYLVDPARTQALLTALAASETGDLIPTSPAAAPLSVGDLAGFVRPQGWGHFHVLASPEADQDSDDGADLVGRDGFDQLHHSLAALYEIMIIDTGNNIRAANWRAAVDKADELVIVSTIREATAQSAAWMLDALRRRGKQDLIARSVTVLSEPDGAVDAELRTRIQRHFGARTRAVLSVPHDDALVAGGAINYAALASRTRDAWMAVGAAVTEGL